MADVQPIAPKKGYPVISELFPRYRGRFRCVWLRDGTTAAWECAAVLTWARRRGGGVGDLQHKRGYPSIESAMNHRIARRGDVFCGRIDKGELKLISAEASWSWQPQ